MVKVTTFLETKNRRALKKGMFDENPGLRFGHQNLTAGFGYCFEQKLKLTLKFPLPPACWWQHWPGI